ncbi:MAG: GGDEF domain-containing protein [Pseudomonadota bacterium]|nr:GGDEF domain-containing protein [Pseudomonadota bacterium]
MSPDTSAAITLCRTLPSPPGVALRIIELAQDPDADIATAADLIAKDMAMSARMLRIANSPLYATRRRIDTLGQALTMLGLNATISLALGFSLAEGMMRGETKSNAALERVWKRSILSGLAARLLGESQTLFKHEELLMSGLLQDIGILALCQLQQHSYPTLLEQAETNQDLLALERDTLGTDHAEVGAVVAHAWGLPDYLVELIRNSDSEPDPGNPMSACVALSGTIADIWLEDDTDAARNIAMHKVHQAFGIDSAHFDRILAQMANALPSLSELFDVDIQSPQRLSDLLEHAKELVVLRNLRELQQAAMARKRADEFETRIKRLSEEASRDELTGLLNRRQLEAMLRQEFELSSRHGWPLSLAFIDIDHFKAINDTHGHATGDAVLRAFAQRISNLLRSDDTIARYGGEEFVILLPNTTGSWAQDVVQRVLNHCAATPLLETQGTSFTVTFSAGIATQGEYERFQDMHALVKAADDMLYRAKHQGKNRVVSRQPPARS